VEQLKSMKIGDFIEELKAPIVVEHRVTFDYQSMAYILATMLIVLAANAFFRAKIG